VVGLLSAAALVAALGALYAALNLRPPAATGTCETTAWSALPKVDALPSGWTTSDSGFFIGSAGTTLVGPSPSDSASPGALIYVSVTCYGADGRRAMQLSHEADLSAGGVAATFPSLGDESFATTDAANASYSIYIRQGNLVANLAATGVDLADLEQAARAVADAMRAAQ
jgi:hypothetical protein